MSDYFFYDLNKKMADLASKQQLTEDAKAAPAKSVRSQLNERDLGKHNNATTGFAALAKKTGGGEKGARIAGAQLAKMRAKGQVEEGSKPDFLDLDKDGNRKERMKSAARGATSSLEQKIRARLDKLYDKMEPEYAIEKVAQQFGMSQEELQHKLAHGFNKKFDKSMDEVAKYRDPKYKDKLYTQEPPDYTYGPDYDDAYDNPKPDDYAGRKRKISGGSGDPLTRGHRMSADKSINTHGKRKGLPSRDQITSLKQSIKDVHGRHSEPNLPEGGVPMTPKQKSFAKLAPPVDKITFADKIVGAKKEVDEVLGDVAANAMKKAIQSRTRDMEEGSMDDDPFSRKSSTGGRIDTTRAGVTRHHAGKSYSGAGHDAGADDTPSGALGRRKVGAGKGTKIGAKINTGKSKLMTREGDMDPADQGEYDQEGSMAKDDIKTVVRHAQALEKILGDNDNLPEWVQAKLAKIEGMMTAVDDYMQNQQGDDMDSDDMKMDEESTDKRDSRAERAGKKVAKDIEYDEKKKDGIHGKRRGSEDDKAEKAGKKVTKDIEYDEKKSKKKEVDETTSSGSVATGGAAPKSGGGMTYGKGIYDSMNREVEKMISESMSINMSMNNDSHGGPSNTLTVTATDEDALQLAMLLKSAGLGSQEHNDMSAIHNMDNDMSAIHDMDHDHGDEPGPACGSSDCECDEIEEAYGDTDATDNEPNWPTDQEGTDDAMMYSGGLNGPKSTGQTTVPVIAGQDDRMGYEGSDALRRMMEMAGLSEAAATPQDVPEPTAPVKKAEAPGSAIKVDKNYKPAAPAKGSKLATPQDVPEPVKENKMAQNFLRELSNFKY